MYQVIMKSKNGRYKYYYTYNESNGEFKRKELETPDEIFRNFGELMDYLFVKNKCNDVRFKKI